MIEINLNKAKYIFGNALTTPQENNMLLVLSELNDLLGDSVMVEQASYVLATIFFETGKTFAPFFTPSSDVTYTAKRGFLPLKGKAQYDLFSDVLEGSLVNASLPPVAAKIAVRSLVEGTITGTKLCKYINNKKVDYINARRTVDGIASAKEIAQIARNFQVCLSSVTNT